MFGGLVATVGLIGSSFATGFLTIFIMYGLVVGLGWGLCFTPSSFVVSHYFKEKHHGLIFAIAACGVGFGHFLTPVLLEALTNWYNWRGLILIQAGCNMHLCLGGAVLRPLPGMKSSKETGGIFQLAVFKNFMLDHFLLHCFLLTLGLSVVFVHFAYGVETFARVGSDLSSTAVGIMGISGIAGRFVHCMLIKRVNNAITYYMCSFFITSVSLCALPYANTFPLVVVCTVAIGFSLAVYGAVQIIIILGIVDFQYTITAYGYLNMVAGLGLFIGAPVAGRLYDVTGNYAVSMYYGGGMMALSVVSLLWLRHQWHRKRLGRSIHADGEEKGSAISREPDEDGQPTLGMYGS